MMSGFPWELLVGIAGFTIGLVLLLRGAKGGG